MQRERETERGRKTDIETERKRETETNRKRTFLRPLLFMLSSM